MQSIFTSIYILQCITDKKKKKNKHPENKVKSYVYRFANTCCYTTTTTATIHTRTYVYKSYACMCAVRDPQRSLLNGRYNYWQTDEIRHYCIILYIYVCKQIRIPNIIPLLPGDAHIVFIYRRNIYIYIRTARVKRFIVCVGGHATPTPINRFPNSRRVQMCVVLNTRRTCFFFFLWKYI